MRDWVSAGVRAVQAGCLQSAQSQAPDHSLSSEEVGGEGLRQVLQAVPGLARHQVGVAVDELPSVVDTPAQAGVLRIEGVISAGCGAPTYLTDVEYGTRRRPGLNIIVRPEYL